MLLVYTFGGKYGQSPPRDSRLCQPLAPSKPKKIRGEAILHQHSPVCGRGMVMKLKKLLPRLLVRV